MNIMSEKYGFVYIWRDRKHKRYYIGSHWGTERDGYICSSRWMRKSYKRRPEDFKRRIVARVDDRSLLLEEEHRWLLMIKSSELGKRYYNLTQHKPGHWTTSPDARTIGQKISAAHKSDPNRGLWLKGKKQSADQRQKHSRAKQGRRLSPETEFKPGIVPWNKNIKGLVTVSEETRKKISEALTGRVASEETRQKLRDRDITAETREKLRKANLGKRHLAETKLKMSRAHTGKRLSEETKKKISEASKGHTLSDEARRKISEAQKGVNNDPRSVKVEFEGEIYTSLRSAAKATGKNYQHIRKYGKRIT